MLHLGQESQQLVHDESTDVAKFWSDRAQSDTLHGQFRYAHTGTWAAHMVSI